MRLQQSPAVAQFAAGQRYNFEDCLVDVQLIVQRRRLSDERAYPADEVAGSSTIPDDPVKCLTNLFQIWRLGTKPAPRCIGIGQRRGDRLADFMGDRSRQLACGCHPIGVGELHLRIAQARLAPTQFLLGPPQILDVGALCIPFDDATPFVAQRDKAQQKSTIFPVELSQTGLLFERLSGRECRAPLVHGAVVGV